MPIGKTKLFPSASIAMNVVGRIRGHGSGQVGDNAIRFWMRPAADNEYDDRNRDKDGFRRITKTA